MVVGGDIIGRVPQLHLPRQDRDGEGGAMVNEMGALIGVGRGGGVAQGQFQAEFPVDIGGLQVQVAKDALCLERGPWYRRGSRPWPQGPRAPWGNSRAARPGGLGCRWHHVRRTAGTSSSGSPSSVAICWRSERGAGPSGTSSISSRATVGSLGCALLGGGLAHLVDDVGERAGELEPLGTAVELVAQLLLAGLVDAERPAALTGVRTALIA